MNQGADGQDRELGERLRALREDPPDGGFQASLHRRLVAAGAPERRNTWARLLWPAVGFATAVAVFIALQLFRAPEPVPAVLIAATEVPASKVAVIKLNFTADVSVESAEFQVSLPDGLAFWMDGQELPERSFAWTQPLRAGDNVIPIAVRGQRPGRYRVTASARVGGEQIEHDVVLEVTNG